jgi:hypothetical protein
VEHVTEQHHVSPIRGRDSQRHLRKIEGKVNKAEPLFGPPKALNDCGNYSQGQRLRDRHIADADQKENEVY